MSGREKPLQGYTVDQRAVLAVAAFASGDDTEAECIMDSISLHDLPYFGEIVQRLVNVRRTSDLHNE